MPYSINHMTVKAIPTSSLLDMALALNCAGVELRNDLPSPLFDGQTAQAVGKQVAQLGLRIFALAEVKAFNDFNENTRKQAIALMDLAVECGAIGVALIPRCDGQGLEKTERIASLTHAIEQLTPLLAERKLIGFVEPLGFEHSSLRLKSEAVDVIKNCDASEQFQLVHDTFHHFLAGGGALFPEHTGMVHVSGVVDKSVALNEINDVHRILVDEHDRLENIEQLSALLNAGYTGPISMEAFAPSVHALAQPADALNKSFGYITSKLQESGYVV